MLPPLTLSTPAAERNRPLIIPGPSINDAELEDIILDVFPVALPGLDALIEIFPVVERDFFQNIICTESLKTVNGYCTKVNAGQQNKYILGTNEYKNALNNGQNKSIMYGDISDIQSLLNDKAGTGDFLAKEKIGG